MKRIRRSPQQWKTLLETYRSVPPNERRAWLKKHKVASSVLYRKKVKLNVNTDFAQDTPAASAEPTRRSLRRQVRRQAKAESREAELLSQLVLLKGLLQIACKAGFLDAFLSEIE